MSNANEIWGRRLKEARVAAGLSQKQLGIQAGLDQFVASTRINRYELGIHKADYSIVQNLSKILDVPAGYFYTEEDNLAELMLVFHRMPGKKKNDTIKFVRTLARTE
ncbi:Helix-turn-helix domain-containing protein [Collimonas sp. OK607]|uniref:helix-turn-helix domain-containing protein n=1 Tax=Collimonas sp. OK607 TaxID=1798194 RepID=UPI0008EE03D7|nr:helix-turn-helix transcriptional regulator [Collimonas sp. OK607]SFB27852.1 Helix-turn-helix domain-containing protein [Collimonas sp. OK607]